MSDQTAELIINVKLDDEAVALVDRLIGGLESLATASIEAQLLAAGAACRELAGALASRVDQAQNHETRVALLTAWFEALAGVLLNPTVHVDGEPVRAPRREGLQAIGWRRRYPIRPDQLIITVEGGNDPEPRYIGFERGLMPLDRFAEYLALQAGGLVVAELQRRITGAEP